MLLNKKFVALMTSVALVFSIASTTVVSASSASDAPILANVPGYYEGFSQYTGLSVHELQKIYQQHGELGAYFGVHVDAQKLRAYSQDPNGFSTLSGGGGNVKEMTDAQWNSIKDKGEKGDILATRDTEIAFVNVGHVGIIFKKGEKTIEAPEPNVTSRERDFTEVWRKRNTMRVYQVKTANAKTRVAASDHADKNLKGKTYYVLAGVDDDSVNCATLVWKAYKSQSIELGKAAIAVPNGTPFPYVYFTSTPQKLVEDSTNLKRIAQVNWSGGENSW
jgi:uncharacterized protein YycO